MSAPTGDPSPRDGRAAAALAAWVAAALDDHPPLTPEQISRIAVLLRPTAGHLDGDAAADRAA